MTAANIVTFWPNDETNLIDVSDRLGMLTHKASALNLAIRGLDADKHLVAALDYLSQELAHEIGAFRDEIDEHQARRRKANEKRNVKEN